MTETQVITVRYWAGAKHAAGTAQDALPTESPLTLAEVREPTAGGADGVMGQKTKNAIVAFQKDNNLPANGEVTEKLVQELLARK